MLKHLTDLLKSAFSYKEALEREHLTQENVELLREKLKSSKVVPLALADQQLIFFLSMNKNDIDKCVTMLETSYTVRRSLPEFFKNRDVESIEIQNSLDILYYITLPVTPDNHMLVYHSLRNNNPDLYDYNAATKTFIMITEVCSYHHGPRSGIIFLFDLKGLTSRHLLKPSISILRKGARLLQEGTPLNIKEVHVFNSTAFIDLIIAIAKPLIHSEFLQKLCLHRSDINFEKFHEEYIPKTHLPNEYGGILGTLEELHQKSRESLMDLRDYFIYEEQQSNFELDEYVDLSDLQNID